MTWEWIRRVIARITLRRSESPYVTRAQSNIWGDCEFCGVPVGDCHLSNCQDIRREVLNGREQEESETW